MAGNWEPLACRRRSGYSSDGDAKSYEYEHSEELATRLAKLGINAVVWHGYKGLGFEFEKEEIEYTRQFGQHCRKHNIRFGTYANLGSFFAETMFRDHPQARSWLSEDMTGEPHPYSEFYRVYFRYRPCLTNQDFIDYVKRMVLYLVKHAGSEWVHLDNHAMMPCYCQKCRRQFHTYLREKYPEDTPQDIERIEQRFGFTGLEHMLLPRGTSRMPIDTLPACHEPILQEWVAYRCSLVTDA